MQLDCGIHPGLSGMDALPFVDLIEADEIDLLLISQYEKIFNNYILCTAHKKISEERKKSIFFAVKLYRSTTFSELK